MRKTKRRVKKARPQPSRPSSTYSALGSVSVLAAPQGKVESTALPRSGGRNSDAEPRTLALRERTQAIPTGTNATYLDLECLAEMPFEPLDPLWGSVVARGAVTVLAGEPGVGKSFVALNIAAAVTRGELGPRIAVGTEVSSGAGEQASNGRIERHDLVADSKVLAHADTECAAHHQCASDLPILNPTPTQTPPPAAGFANPADPRPGQGVLICSPHYERSTTLMRRLRAAKADLSLVQTINGVRRTQDFGNGGPCWSFQLARDLAIFEQELMLLQGDETDIGLVVIDPFPFGVSGSGAKQAKVLQELTSRLAEIAYICQVAVLLVCEALPLRDSKRAASITAYPGVERLAQSIWVVERDHQSPDRRLLLPAKLADEERAPGLAFVWRDGAIEWVADDVSMTAQEYRSIALQRAKNPLMEEDASELGRASDWLQTRLGEGPVDSRLIKQEADDNEISYTTLRRAFCALRIESTRIKNTRHHQWGAVHGRGAGENGRVTGDGGEKQVECGEERVEVGVKVGAHDELVLEHESEHLFQSVNHGVFDVFPIDAQSVQQKLETEESEQELVTGLR